MDTRVEQDTHVFDRAVALKPLATGAGASAAQRFRGRTSADYANMVGPYGGITAAQLLQAVMLHPDRLGDPVSFTGNFAAAVADGQFTIEANPVRTNRSTQHWTVTMTQAGDDGTVAVVSTATVVTALRRETWGATDLSMPSAPAVDAIRHMPRIPSPAWLARYDMRWFRGAMPREWNDQESPDSVTAMWVRDEPPRPLDYPSLLALSDVFYPRVWLRRARTTPIGTVSFTVYFHVDDDTLAACGSRHLLAHAKGQRFFNGYFDQSGDLWSPDGILLATTHQIVYYRD